MRKPLLAPVNGRRSNITCDHLKASVRQLLSIITKPTTNNEGELSFALNVSAIQPLDEVGITDHLRPVDGLLISLSLRVQSFKPACCIPPLHKLLGELLCLCSCLIFHLTSPVFSVSMFPEEEKTRVAICPILFGRGSDISTAASSDNSSSLEYPCCPVRALTYADFFSVCFRDQPANRDERLLEDVRVGR